ncbi:uncharacterized protein LOC135947629 [Cloeon dipterum]|uniref:uncharacterized protein LOC135947629 n=1 Tax=Cloeon dipterum TaxID=197152 RepID=UPI00322095D1
MPNEAMPPREGRSTFFKPPTYSSQHADKFFTILEGRFQQFQIVDEIDKYLTLASALDFDDLPEAAGNLVRKMPDATPYTQLKAALLENLKPQNYEALRARMKEIPLGSLKPSEFLARLRATADEATLANPIFKADLLSIWRAAMPAEWRHVLIVEPDIDEAAKKADVLRQYQPPQAVPAPEAAASAPGPSCAALRTSADPGEQRLAALEAAVNRMTEMMYLMQVDSPRGNQEQRGRKKQRDDRSRDRRSSRTARPNPLLVPPNLWRSSY